MRRIALLVTVVAVMSVVVAGVAVCRVRSDARTCSPACRQRAYRQRKVRA